MSKYFSLHFLNQPRARDLVELIAYSTNRGRGGRVTASPNRAALRPNEHSDSRECSFLQEWGRVVNQKNMEIPPKIRDFLDNSRIPLPPITDLDEPLHIDSLGFIRLIAFLDNECGIRFEEEELVVDNFSTLRRLGELIASKSRAPSARD